MSGVRADERGFTLPELLITMTTMLVVVFAMLTTFDVAVRGSSEAAARTDAQDAARTSLDGVARQLRNLASPTPQQPQAVDRIEPYDIVFQTVDPNGPNAGLNVGNVRRVRYCLDSSTPDRGKLYLQQQTWTTVLPPAVPSSTGCPGTGWTGTAQVVADHVVNRRAGADRPVFAANSAVLTDVSQLHAELVVDVDPGRGAAETKLATGVFLRNQNRKPVASFTATTTAQGIVLNGSTSSDPEGDSLQYVWYDGTTKVGTGVVFTYAVSAGSSHAISLKVYDSASLEGVAPTQTVVG